MMGTGLLVVLALAQVDTVVVAADSVMELALAAGYESPEAFSRAFKRLSGQSPSEYRDAPRWLRRSLTCEETEVNTEVDIVDFPDTAVAAVEYKGPERHSLMATRKQ